MFGKSLDTARSQAYSVARYFFEILGVEENDEYNLQVSQEASAKIANGILLILF